MADARDAPPPASTYTLRRVLVPRRPDEPSEEEKREDEPKLRRSSQNTYLGAIEDGALAAGGLVATAAGVLNEPRYVMFGLVVGAVGKALPSIGREIRDYWARKNAGEKPAVPPRSFASEANPRPPDPALYGNPRTHLADASADGLLPVLAHVGGILFWLKSPTWALALIGFAFILKAGIDLGEDWYIASNPSDPDLKSSSGGDTSRGTESMVFLLFGLTALVIVHWPAAANTQAASYALGFSALGKAFPSLLSSKSGGGGSTGSDPSTTSYDLYEVSP